MRFLLLGLLMISLCGIACTPSTPTDGPIPVQATSTEEYTQTFYIQSSQDTLWVSSKGAVLSIPACAFETDGIVEISLIEAYRPAAFIDLCLTTQTVDGTLLESAGMFRLDAKDEEGQRLSIQTNCAPLLMFDSRQALHNAQQYEGQEQNGQIVWKKDAQPLQHWLTPIPLEELQFFPMLDDFLHPPIPPGAQRADTTPVPLYCGLGRQWVQQLYQSKFENTLIATAEFEARMPMIHRSCDPELLLVYLRNLDRPMYEIDSLAYEFLWPKRANLAGYFKQLSNLGLTTVPNAQALSSEYLEGMRALQKRRKEERIRELQIQYSLTLSTAGVWYNIDALNHGEALYHFDEKVTLALPDGTEPPMMSVYCLLENSNSIAALPYQIKEQCFGYVDNYAGYLKTKEITLCAMAEKEGQTYAVQHPIKLGAQKYYDLILQPVNDSTFREGLNAYGTPQLKSRVDIEASMLENCCEPIYIGGD